MSQQSLPQVKNKYELSFQINSKNRCHYAATIPNEAG